MDPDVLESAYRAVVDALQPDTALSADPERELAEVAAALQRAVAEEQEGADDQLATVRAWTRALAFHPALARRRQTIASFHVPHKTDHAELVPRVRPRPELPEYFQGPPETRRYRDGFDLTDPRFSPRENLREAHYCMTCHERGQGLVLDGTARQAGGRRGKPARDPPRRLPPRREDLGDDPALPRRPPGGRARRHHDRQPDARGHRAPHLQRLHEVLHLPEAGPGEHPADRDRHPDRSAGPALRLRDRLAADALEPAQPAPAVSRCATTARTCSWWAWGRRATRWPTTC